MADLHATSSKLINGASGGGGFTFVKTRPSNGRRFGSGVVTISICASVMRVRIFKPA
jgi:hypothetical protein